MVRVDEFRERFKRRAKAPFKHVTVTAIYPLCHLLGGQQVVAEGRIRSYDDISVALQMARSRLTDTGWLEVKVKLIEG